MLTSQKLRFHGNKLCIPHKLPSIFSSRCIKLSQIRHFEFRRCGGEKERKISKLDKIFREFYRHDYCYVYARGIKLSSSVESARPSSFLLLLLPLFQCTSSSLCVSIFPCVSIKVVASGEFLCSFTVTPSEQRTNERTNEWQRTANTSYSVDDPRFC